MAKPKDKYEAWLQAAEPPPSLSIMEAGVLGRMLGIDVDGITKRQMQAQFEELHAAIRAGWGQRPRRKARKGSASARKGSASARKGSASARDVPASAR